MGKFRITENMGNCGYKGVILRDPSVVARSLAMALLRRVDIAFEITAATARLTEVAPEVGGDEHLFAEAEILVSRIAMLRIEYAQRDIIVADLEAKIKNAEEKQAVTTALETLGNRRINELSKELRFSKTEAQRATLQEHIQAVSDLMSGYEAPEGGFTDDEQVEVQTADWSPDLSAGMLVGTVEPTGNPQAVLIKPGGASHDHGWDSGDDGDGIAAAVNTMSPEGAFWNFAMLPGFQKWKPKYRAGVVYEVRLAEEEDNTSGVDECDLVLSTAISQAQGLNINQGENTDNLLRDFGVAEPPAGFRDMCLRFPDADICNVTGRGQTVTVTDEQVEELRRINAEVNAEMTYRADNRGSNAAIDYWNPSPGSEGDCEDYAIKKWNRLSGSWPNQALRLTACTVNGSGHIVLTVDTDRGTYVLSNGLPLVLVGQAPFMWRTRQNGSGWSNVGGQLLENVPIDYMGQGGVGFWRGAEVLIEFQGRDWDSPKVVGFNGRPMDPVEMWCFDRFLPRKRPERTENDTPNPMMWTPGVKGLVAWALVWDETSFDACDCDYIDSSDMLLTFPTLQEDFVVLEEE